MARRAFGACRSFAIVTAIVCAVAATAEAQESGGSFGGGDFSSGGGGGSDYSGSSGGGDFGSSGGFGGGGVDFSSPGGTGGGGREGAGAAACALIGLLFVVFAIITLAQRRARARGMGAANLGMMQSSGGPGLGVYGYSGPDACHCVAISIGIDWRARAEIQRVLAELARTANLGTPDGRAEALREAVLAMRRAEMAWIYAGPATPTTLHISAAQAHFQSLTTGLRSRFKSELVRGTAGGVRSHEGPEMTAKREEGQGTVVVSVVAAARRPLVPVNAPDANAVKAALDALTTLTPRDLVAMEIIWSPAAENDRMSTGELEQNYPEMRLIDPNSIAGRVFCIYCSGPFPMELLNCPHCGAPALDSKDNRAPRRT